MKEPAAASPFAALTPQEQKERWICWQCQHPADAAPKVDADDARAPDTPLPVLKLPEAPVETKVRPAAPPQPPAHRHSQYDAVINRLSRAQKRTSGFQQWS